jgi:hypothetical protein
MNDQAGAHRVLEDRLRSALRDTAGSVAPDDLAGLEGRIRQRRRQAGRPAGPRWKVIAPVMAASAIAATALVAALLAPGLARHPGGHGTTPGTLPAPASAGEPKYLIANPSGFSPLRVRDAATGALVALVKVPKALLTGPDPHIRRHFQIDWVATADDRTFVVGLFRAIPCQSRLYQFTLNAAGKPGRLIPFAALPVIRGAGVGTMAFSGNGRVLAFSTLSGSPACSYRVTSHHIGVVNLATKTVRQWSGAAGSLSLDFTGKLLAYNTDHAVKVIPTNAPPGPASRYSRVLVTAASFGRPDTIDFAAITPDGKLLCLALFADQQPGEIRIADLASHRSHRSRLVASGIQNPGLIFADQRTRHLLVRTRNELVSLDLRTGKITPLPGPLRKYLGELFW